MLPIAYLAAVSALALGAALQGSVGFGCNLVAALVARGRDVLVFDELVRGTAEGRLPRGILDAVDKGAQEAAKELGAEVIFVGPTTPTAEGQIETLNSLIAQRVDAIAISANDPDALVPTLKKAMDRGIKVVSYDSAVAQPGRIAHLAP